MSESTPPPAHRPDGTFVIFDLDGVLVDTQDAENGGLAHVGELMGLTGLGDDQARCHELFTGKRMQECLDLLEEITGNPPPPNAMPLARARCEELIGDHLEPLDGVADALTRLSERPDVLGMCVASNSPLELIENRLAKAKILHHFDGLLFSAYEVGAWKPDPKLFLWAAESAGHDPDACVVVEDSAVGVAAGIDAGIRVLQYAPAPGTAPHREGAVVFHTMHDLPHLVTTFPTPPGGTR
ncbi:HAD family hydrolase [Streptomyces alkaliterrae]|uniref:HAD family phosphatase n=2 Tax=Streptomyces alkaliterrae TaxID=2213162 RepID=A0A7W3WSM2_9ACTN|nr:HAD family phosphatase [Streptomyces alkaliterrae]MBB1257776.1 HAD family phosphatase [Streptomyces alkaliterrae]